MEPFTTLTGLAAPMPQDNVDTDIILPARFLLITEKRGLGRYAFYEWRYDADGKPRAEFVLNQSRYAGASILVAGENFGCGSSREHAPWALRDVGIRCIVAPSFGEIFSANCFKNGILPVVLGDTAPVAAEALAGRPITIDLVGQTLTLEKGTSIAFGVEAWRREALLNGLDEVGTILAAHEPAIASFEAVQKRHQPWLWA